MKSKIAGAMFLFVSMAILFSPAPGLSQKGGPGGGDPTRMFEQLARGRGYFMLEDTRTLREPMGRWLQQKGITDGKVTRDLFTSFIEESRSSGGMMMFKGGGPGFGKGPGGFPGGGFPGGGFPGGFPGGPGPGGFMPGGGPGRGGNPTAELSPTEINRWGEMEFRRKDYNGDKLLTPEEMEPRLREGLSTWDKNRDGLISMEEFQTFFLTKMNERGDQKSFNPVTIIIEEELLDRRPTMFRAGKDVPKEIRWFAELDTDKDGQVSFYEWRKAGKDRDEFSEYDRNGDFLMTAEEALHYQRKNGTMLASNSSSDESPGNTELKRSEKNSNGQNNMRMEFPGKKFEGRPEGGGKKGKGPPGGGNSNGNGKMKGFGNLTPEQKAKMEELRAKYMKK